MDEQNRVQIDANTVIDVLRERLAAATWEATTWEARARQAETQLAELTKGG